MNPRTRISGSDTSESPDRHKTNEKNTNTMDKEIIKERIIIDLEEGRRSLVPVSKNLFIDFPPRSSDGVFGSLVSKLAMGRTRKNLKINVRNLSISRDLILTEGKKIDDLFSLHLNSEEIPVSALPHDFILDKQKTAFQIYFYPEHIADCRRRQQSKDPDTFKVTGEVFITNAKDEELDSERFEISIELKQLAPEFQIEVGGPKGGRIMYNSVRTGDYVPVGDLRITNPKKLERSPKVNFEGHVSVIGPDGKALEDIEIDGDVSRPRLKIRNSNDGNIFVKGLLSEFKPVNGLLMHVPSRHEILMDFAGILNPLVPYDKYTVKVDGFWTLDYDTDVRYPVSASREFRLMKDMQGTELRVSVNNRPAANSRRNTLETFRFLPGGAFCGEAEIDLVNIATDSSRGGTLRICRPRIVSTLDIDGAMLYDAKRHSVEINDIVTLDGDAYEELCETGHLDIPNGSGAATKFNVRFNPSKIFSTSPAGMYDFGATTTVEFDYYENADGSDWADAERKTFKVILGWNLSLLPFPEWLGLDYGSSAIVCMYGDSLVDLSGQRARIFALEKDRKTWGLASEAGQAGSKFISSDLLFNSVTNRTEGVSMLCSEQENPGPYSQLALCLAPTYELMRTNYERNLPCLKLLVGNTSLPENADYDAYTYHRIDDNGNVTQTSISDARRNEEDNSLSNIQTLFDEAYKIVFRYYLDKQINEIDRVNRVVLTYPNSYTPEHLKVLEKIAVSTFRNIRPGYLRFVSESDAVAAYYMEHWKDYNPTGDMKKTENILVYDMGAGTLDLTYLTKTYDHASDTYTLEIKGKLGISKAGNYLDFVLAKFIDPMLAKTSRPKGANADKTVRGRLDLKEKVKTEVKPMLSGDPSKTITYDGRVIEVADILNSRNLQQYLSECTDGVLERLKNYIGADLVVDTVILSGRSCRLLPLQKALRNAMRAVRPSTPAGIKFHDLALRGDEDRQKTAVVEGAVTLAGSYSDPSSHVRIRSRRLFASFGVAYTTLGGELHYAELANHADMPSSDEKGSRKFTEATLLNMAHSKELILIQSYLSEADTLSRYRNSDFEYITEMSRFNIEAYAGHNELTVCIGIDRNNRVSLYVNGNPAQGKAPKGIDLNNEITKQSIWPATI